MAKKITVTADENGGLWGSIVTGAILGFFIGGSVALLYAPKSGRELRGGLEDAAEDLKARAEEALDDIQERATEIAQSSRTLLEETRENLIRSVEAGRDAYEATRRDMTATLEAQLHDRSEKSGEKTGESPT